MNEYVLFLGYEVEECEWSRVKGVVAVTYFSVFESTIGEDFIDDDEFAVDVGNVVSHVLL